jgi:AcrR family transcriptional regulator
VRTKTPEQADRILAAAGRLFGAQRFHEVRMDDIAEEAEVGKGTLYRYFGDKEELYLALMARCSEEFLHRVEAVLAVSGPARERLVGVVALLIDQFDEQPHLLNLIMRAEVMVEGGGRFPWQEAREKMPRLLNALFKEGEAGGEFAVRDPELMVLMLLGGVRAVIRFGEKPRPAHLARRIVENFLSGADTLQTTACPTTVTSKRSVQPSSR